MARKVTVTLTDDIDDSLEATETVAFALDGVTYEIDVAEKNAKKLRDILSPYTSAGRKVGGRKQRGTPTPSNKVDLNAVRAWAAENGIEVAARGRIAQKVIDQYNSR